MLTRRTVEAVLSFYAVTAAESSLVLQTGSSVTSEVIPESSPSIVLSLSKVRLTSLQKNSVCKQSFCAIQLPESGRYHEIEIDFCYSPELMKKLFEFCGYSVDLRCQLPNGDLETLISVKSDEDLANIVEEYDRVSGAKIRAVLSPPRAHRQGSPSSTSSDLSPKSPFAVTPSPPNSPSSAYGRYVQSRYCLPPTDLGRRYIHGYGESYCYVCRGHKDSRLIRH